MSEFGKIPRLSGPNQQNWSSNHASVAFTGSPPGRNPSKAASQRLTNEDILKLAEAGPQIMGNE